MALEQRPLVDVKVPVGDADGEVAERVGRDVDAAGNKTVALHRREGSIVPDDLGDWISRRHVTSSSAIVRDARPWLGGHSCTLAQPNAASFARRFVLPCRAGTTPWPTDTGTGRPLTSLLTSRSTSGLLVMPM